MKEHLTSISTRKKWREREGNVNKRVVLVTDPNMPRRQLKMGQIVETSPGTDGFVRGFEQTDEQVRLYLLEFPS